MEELHEPLEVPEELEEVLVGVGDIGEWILRFACVVTPDALKGEVRPVTYLVQVIRIA